MSELLDRARVARREGRLPDARRELARAVELSQAGSGDSRLPVVLTACGQIERDLGDVDGALKRYGEAEAIFRESKQMQALAHTIRHIADMHREARRLAAAEPLYSEALAIYSAEPATGKLDPANTFRGFALLQQDARRTDEAMPLWRKAREIYSDSGIHAGVAECDSRLEVTS